MNVKRWLREHSLKLLAIRDTPEAIAGGVAIGIFFGFTPLFGVKTICAIFFAWLTRSNIIATVLAGTLHDLALPLMPAIFLWEYQLGYWVLNQEWPHRVTHVHLAFHDWHDWTHMVTSKVGKPMLLGSMAIASPLAGIAYFVTKAIVIRHHRRHPSAPADEEKKTEPESPS